MVCRQLSIPFICLLSAFICKLCRADSGSALTPRICGKIREMINATTLSHHLTSDEGF
jgi:hypothetical protein